MSEQKSVAPTLREPVRGPSAVLSEAREGLGLSQKDVADKLFLTTTFIKYIDDGEFDRIHKPAFIKGYLRTYARVVELSGDLIVELYEKELQSAEPAPEIKGVTDEKVGTASITGPVLQTGLIAMGVLVLVIALIWWLVSDTGEDEPLPQLAQPSIKGPEVTETTVVAFDYVVEAGAGSIESNPDADNTTAQLQFADNAPAGLISSTDETPAGIQNIEAGVQNIEVPPVPEIETAEPIEDIVAEEASRGAADTDTNPIKIQRNSDGEQTYISVDAGGFEQMDLSFRDECWVEINDGQHGLIYHDLNRADDVLTVYGTLPFRVLLGKATGVEMIYNGRPFDLEPHISQDQTAKLTITE